MNYVFISPHFPPNYKYFVIQLARLGIRVLGIGAEEYDNLDEELRQHLVEYFRVENMEDENEVLRACGYFTFRYGKIDRIESHNEYWLEQDARLRTDFNVFGLKNRDMQRVKTKSKMKEIFQSAGIPVAQGSLVHSLEKAKAFIKEVGYPVVAKPDNGVGAAHTYKLENEDDLLHFFLTKPDTEYFMEAFVTGQIHSFDGLTDKEGRVVFMNSFIFPKGVMETVNDKLDMFYYSQRDIPEDLRRYGLDAVKAFELRERFFHIEFFRTPEGELIALEVNVRPPGGLSMDIFNYANQADLYALYARLVKGEEIDILPRAPYHVAYVGLKHTPPILEVEESYGDLLIQQGPIPSAFAAALGNYGFIFMSEDLEPLFEAAAFAMNAQELK